VHLEHPHNFTSKRRKQVFAWLKGIIPPLVTPFDEQGKIDPSALKAEVEFQISSGATAVCVGGSTGEGAGFTPDEAFQLCSLCVEYVQGRVPVIGGAVPDTTDEAVELGMASKKAGVKALQVTPPHYLFRPDTAGLVSYYSQIRQSTGLPVILYNVIPWAQVSAEAMGKLIEAGAIDGVKQSGSNLHLLADILYEFGDRVPILTAVDDLLYPSFILGSPGAVAAIVTVLPREAVALYNAVKVKDLERALEYQNKLRVVWRALEGETGFPGRVKYAISLQGRKAGLPRQPHSAANDEDRARIRRAFKEAAIPIAE
jgi:4-hydroxy-tetrahydrodipicolinate synthase